MKNAFLDGGSGAFDASLARAEAQSDAEINQLLRTLDAAPAPVSAPPAAPEPQASPMAPPKLRQIYDQAARDTGVPANVLMAMGYTESSHQTAAQGPTTKWGRAKGLMQYLDGTAANLGINPMDARDSIYAAANQIKERLAKGYTMRDAVMEHHAGPDRAQWGPKTEDYGKKVLRRAAELFDQYQQEQAAQDAATVQRREAGREQAAADKRAEYYQNPATRGIANPTAQALAAQAAAKPATLPASEGLGVFGYGEQLRSLRGETAPAAINPPLDRRPGQAMAGYAGGGAPAPAQAGISNERARALLGPALGDALAAQRRQSLLPDMGADAIARRAQTAEQNKADTRQRNLAAAKRSLSNQIANDFGRGMGNLKAMGSGLVAAAADIAGADGIADAALRDYIETSRRNDIDHPSVIGSYKNIGSLGDAGRYAVEAVMENLPMFLPSLVTGGASLIAARQGAEAMVTKIVAEQMAKKVGRAAAEKAAVKAVERHIMARAAAGTGLASTGMETGSIMGDIYEKTGQKRGGLALGYGAVAGLLDTIQPVMALRAIAGPVVDQVAGHVIRRLGAEAGKQFLVEAGTEGLQTIIENAAVSHADGRKLFTPELLDDVIDSALKGGIGGGVIGTVSEGVHALRAQGAPLKPEHDYQAATAEAFAKAGGPLARVAAKAAAAMPAPATRPGAAQTEEVDRPPADMDPYLPEEGGNAPAATTAEVPAAPEPFQPGEILTLHTPHGAEEVLVERLTDNGEAQVVDNLGDSYLVPLDGGGDMRLERPAPTRRAAPEWQAPPKATLGDKPVTVASPAPFQLAERAPKPVKPDIDGALADSDARVAAADQARSRAQRAEILDRVLSRPEVRHPGMAFAAELRRQGFRETEAHPEERQRIERYQAAREAFHAPAETERALPNEMDVAALVPEKRESAAPEKASRPAAVLPAELKPLADKARSPQQFYQLAKKAGVPDITREEVRRQLLAGYKAYRADPSKVAAPAKPAAQPAPAAQPMPSPAPEPVQAAAPAAPAAAPNPPARAPGNWHAKARQVDVTRDSVRDAIARLGGLRKDQALSEWGKTLVEGQRSRVFGKPLFRSTGGTGLTLDHAREALEELGYLPPGSDINDLYEAFGKDAKHAARLEQEARAAGQTQAAADAADVDVDPFNPALAHDPLLDGPARAWLPDEELVAAETERLTDAEAEQLQTMVAALQSRYDADQVESLLETLAQQTADQPHAAYIQALEQNLNEQNPERERSAGQPESPAGKQPDQGTGRAAPDRGEQREEPAPSFLESYDQAEISRREAAAREAEAQRKREEQAAERKRQTDAEVSDFVLTGSDATHDELAARGQGGLFDAPPAAPKAQPAHPPAQQAAPAADPPASPAPTGIRAKSGQPFKSLGVAKLQLARHPGHEAVAVAGGYELRPTTPAATPTPAANPASDFPTRQIADSYRNISHNGSSAAKVEEAAFTRAIEQIQNEVEPLIETEAQRQAFDAAMDDYRRGYIDAALALARVREGTVSWHVAGRNNFNSRQAARTGSAYEDAQDEFARKVSRLQRAVGKAVRQARTPAQIEAEQQKAAGQAHRQRIVKFARAAGAIADDLRNGRVETAKDTRKWANKDMMALLDDMDDATRREAVERADKALQDLKGLAAVVGPRSALGQRVAQLLAGGEQAAAGDNAGKLANATAPEHVQGVDDRELSEIVAEFNQAQAAMMDGDHPVSNVFQPPKKSDIVRLNDKAKVYHKEHGWMTPAQAKARIAEWKTHAKAQGADPAIRSANSDKIVLSLFDLSGEWSRPWEEAGYQVYRFDIQADPQVGDVNNFSSDFFGDWFGDFEGKDIYAILAACPCTDFAVSGARHFAAKDADGRTVASVKLVHQTLRTIEYFKPAVWALENPVGRIEELGGLPPWRLSFDPNHLGDPYTKKTLIWGRFNGDLPVAPVEPTEGSKMHRLYGGKSQATKNARSVTPEGFSYGFFMANNAHDHAAMAVANKFDRLDPALIGQAIEAGVTPEQIEEAVEDSYYIDLDDAAANQAVRELLTDAPPPDKTGKAEPADRQTEDAPAGRPLQSALWDDFADWWNGLASGENTTAAEVLQAFDLLAAPEGLAATLQQLKVPQLQRLAGWSAHPGDKKADLIRKVRENTLARLLLDKEHPSFSFTFGEDIARKKQEHEAKVREQVASLTDADVRAFAEGAAKDKAERESEREARTARLADPQTLDDYRDLLRQRRAENELSPREAYLSLTPAQRARYDELEAEHTRSARVTRQQAARNAVATAKQKTGAQVLETKHTKQGHDLFVVQLDERVDRDSYNTLNAAAKRMGGYYSKYRGGGAIPGFQFRDRASAEAFAQLAQGDSQAAQEAVTARGDAFDDDKSQSAAERLRAMAARLDELADASLSRDRKANTARRARFAAAAEAQASAQKAEAATMRRLADGIESGDIQFLNLVRQKVQIEALDKHLSLARWNALKAKHGANWDRHRDDPITPEVADHAEWPTYTGWRQDLAALGRQLAALPGGKQLGERLQKGANDVTDDYLAFARDNLLKVSGFRLDNGKPAVFSNREAAERAIARSDKRGQAIVLPIKRGENAVILSPQAAAEAGVWQAQDKRVALNSDFAAELVDKIRQHPTLQHRAQGLLTTAEQLKRLAGMGIETATELRAALREYIGLREAPAAPDQVKQLERAMVGRQKDGLDFFPTGPEAVRQMLDAAELEPGMRVLEPSAGMGHIAEAIRAAGADPEVVELSPARRELLEAKGFNLVGDDFLAFNDANHAERGFTYGDLMEAPDGTRGILRGQGGMGSDRVRLVSDEPASEARTLGKYNFSELVGVERRGVGSGYDRIVMNPPFSDRRDAEHVMHAYGMLKPGGRLVAIMGEGVFFGQDKKAKAFREWLEQVGGTSEKLPAGSFEDPSLPVTTGAHARLVVVDKVAELDAAGASFSLGFDRNDQAIQSGLGGSVTPELGRVDDDYLGEVERFVRSWASQFRELPNPVVVDRFDSLPAAVLADAKKQGGDAENAQGVYDHRTNSIYLIAGNHANLAEVETTLLHEVLGHYALDRLGGDAKGERQRFKHRFAQHLGFEKIMRIAERHQLDGVLRDYDRPLALAGTPLIVRDIVMLDELYARLAERGKPGMRQRLLEVLGAFRQWLRDKGFARLSQLGESDLALLLKHGRELVEKGSQGAVFKGLRYSQGTEAPPAGMRVEQARAQLEAGPLGAFIAPLLESQRIQLHQMVRTRNTPEGMTPRAIQGITTADGTIHLVTGNLSADTLMPVLVHEMFHSSVRPMLGEAQWAKLLSQLEVLRQQAERSGGRTGELFAQARERVNGALEAGAPMNAAEELGAYAIELAEQAPRTWRMWADRLIGAAKAFLLRRFGRQLGRVTPDQLRALSIAALKEAARAQRQGSMRDGFRGMALAGAYSVGEDEVKQASDRLRRIATAIANGSRHLSNQPIALGMTPEPLRQAGAPALPLMITDVKKLFQLVKNESERHDGHGLNAELLSQVPYALQQPLAVFQSGTQQDALVAVTELQDANGSPVIVAIHLNKLRNRQEINKVASIYGKDRAKQIFADWQERGLLRYWNAKRFEKLRAFGLQLSTEEVSRTSAKTINKLPDDVNVTASFEDGKFSIADTPPRIPLATYPDDKDMFANRDENIALGFDVQKRLQQLSPSWAQRLRDVGLKGLRPALSALPGNAVVELYRKSMPALFTAQRLGERLDGRRQQMQSEADEVFRRWQALPGKTADTLADLMHEATIWGIHPDQEPRERWRPEWVNKHEQLSRDWQRLPEEAREVYREVRDLYEQRSEEMFQALADRIDRVEDIPATQRQRMVLQLRQSFDRNKGEGPYFPLARFGDYLVIAHRIGGDDKPVDKIVLSAETEAEQKAMAEDLKRRGFDSVKLDRAAWRKPGSDSGPELTQFAASVMGKLEEMGLSAQEHAGLLDDINQMLIEALPPASARKHYKHRRAVPGFSRDAIRAFVRAQSSLASHIANLEYQDRIDKELRRARKQAAADQENVNEFAQVVDEMEERADKARTFRANPIANAITQLGMFNFLGFSLSQGILNLTQVPLLTYPTLAARFGDGKATAALSRATALVGKAGVKPGGENRFDVRKLTGLNREQRDLLKMMTLRGKLDMTMALDLARAGGASQAPGRNVFSRGFDWVGRYMGVFSHVTEAANRQITALAAYELARENGMSPEQAQNYAAYVLDQTQFNYAFSNRPRILMSNPGRVIGMLHTFAINALYRVGRNMALAMTGKNQAERKMACRFLVRTLALQTAFAGLSSLPLVPLAAGVAGAAAYKASGSRVVAAGGVMLGMAMMEAMMSGFFHDDDEPFDWRAELRAFLVDITGSKTAAELLDKGLLRTLGVDVANRISMNDLLIRDVETGPRNNTAKGWLEQAFIQMVGGAAFGSLVNYARSVDLASRGHYHRAAEAALPKFAADLLKSARYAREDIRVVDGLATVKRGDANAYQVAVQAMGFSPAEVAEKNAEIRTIREAQGYLASRRSDLSKAWVAGKLNGDEDQTRDALAEIAKWNRQHPELRIRRGDLVRSLRNLKRGVSKEEGGQIGSKRYQGVVREVDQFNTD
ncbi:hypothetical protein CEK28_08690 [Xenophilus sp. AP218F]|nr:hypothetical protein CEK28_08690 [Xenophilus sp. AP218F]